ncbi:MAG: hypothetical protein KKE17_02975 [Proteobacteria bacterium]|nr:hypothetical protein [Pseudomonadota bacterium]MBU1708945.1 hypothetical protein [Pseudomonadota bacterium]
MTQSNIQATEEQVLYAKILEKGMYFGLALMFITFALYVFGVMKPAIPLDQLANYWHLPVTSHEATADHEAVVGYIEKMNQEYLHEEQGITGWAWVKFVGKGDFLNFIPIAILSGVTILCYGAIVPGLFRRGDTAYAVMAIVEVLILSLAASGLLTVGH